MIGAYGEVWAVSTPRSLWSLSHHWPLLTATGDHASMHPPHMITASLNWCLSWCCEMKEKEWGLRPPFCTNKLNWAKRTSWGWWENLLRMVRWTRWHCPPYTAFKIRTLTVWGRARYFFHTILSFYEWAETKHCVSLKLKGQSGVRTRDLRLSKQAALTTAPGSPSPPLCCEPCGPLLYTKQPRDIKQMLVQWWADIVDQHWMNVSCLLGRMQGFIHPFRCNTPDVNTYIDPYNAGLLLFKPWWPIGSFNLKSS